MKPAVAVALIVCGTLLLATPATQSYLLHRDAAAVLMARPDISQYTTSGETMTDTYRYLCWTLGICMVAIAVTGSTAPRPTHQPVDASDG